MTMRAIGVLAAALATVVSVASCGDSPSPSADGGGSATSTVSAERSQADFDFVHAMIELHSQAVTTAELAPARASSPQVTQLATTIAQTQRPQIEEMLGLLDAWEAATGTTDRGGKMPVSDGPGMMSKQQVQQLRQASGAAFDRVFLELMIAHHTGAVQTAGTELRDGRNPQAKALAQRIVDDQTAEIEQMRQLLATV